MSFEYYAYWQDRQLEAVPRNRRAAVRYKCPPATLGRITPVEKLEYQRAWVVDLSLKGVGLLLTRPLEIGTQIAILLKSATQKRSFELVGRVVHATLQASSDWLIGCELAKPLTEEELDALL
jgi:hypothetical protein